MLAMQLHLIFITLLASVLSDNVTFTNVTVQFQAFDDYYESSFDVDSSNNLKNILPDKAIFRVTVAGTVPVIYKDAIRNLSDLTILQLQRLQIEEVEPGAFQNLPQLEVLRLNANKIKTIQEGVFNNLHIEYLTLEHNLIVNISLKAFDNLPNLKVLSLDGNRLKDFHPEWVEGKPNLATASFMYNEIEKLPDGAFANYHNDIFFSNNKISRISHGIFGTEEKRLNQFWISDNYIEDWDESLVKGVKIQTFDISNNKLECLDGNFSDFFVAFQTRIDGNPWKCECLDKIHNWKEQNKVHRIHMRSSIKKCNSSVNSV